VKKGSIVKGGKRTQGLGAQQRKGRSTDQKESNGSQWGEGGFNEAITKQKRRGFSNRNRAGAQLDDAGYAGSEMGQVSDGGKKGGGEAVSRNSE